MGIKSATNYAFSKLVHQTIKIIALSVTAYNSWSYNFYNCRKLDISEYGYNEIGNC